MIRKNTLIGAAGAGALVAVALVGPASAAGEETATVNYNCSDAAHPVATYAVDAPPASMVAGQTVSLPTTATFSLSAADTALAKTALGGATTTQLSGTITTTASNSAVGQAIALPKTTLGNDPDTVGATLITGATGTTKLRYTTAGTHTLAVGDAGKVQLQGYKADDTPAGTFTFPNSIGFGPCLNPTGPTHLQAAGIDATVAVSKDSSTTTVGAAYSKAKKQTTATAKVRGKNFNLIGTGKVTFKLKKGTTTLATIKGVKLNSKGIAKAVFKKALRHGKYKVVASYGGSAGLKASTGSHAFSVS